MNDSDIQILNLARDVLDRLQAFPTATESPRLAEAAAGAGNAVFRVLNVANTYAGVEMTDTQIHNRKADDLHLPAIDLPEAGPDPEPVR